jgi:hypothetical protein
MQLADQQCAHHTQAAEAKATAERMADSTRRARERNSAASAKAAIEKAKSKERAVSQKRKAVAAAKGDSGPGKCVHQPPDVHVPRAWLMRCMHGYMRRVACTTASSCLRLAAASGWPRWLLRRTA